MAAHSKHERRNRSVEAEGAHPPPKRRSVWLLAMLALLAALVWLLPGIVAHTPLLQWGVSLATADLDGAVTVRSASLGWFSPVAVQDVEVKDAQGNPVLATPAVSVDRSLAALLCDWSNLGQIRLDGPKLHLVVRDDGSNLEDLLAKYLATEEKEETKSSVNVRLALEIVDGSLSVTDQRLGRTWQVQKLAASFEMLEGPNGPMAAKVTADLPDAQRSGKFTTGVKFAPDGGEASLGLTDFPLVAFRALAARFVPGTTLTGRLSSNLRATWSNQANGQNRVQGDLSLDGFSLATPSLKTDVLRIERLQAACLASWQTDRLEIEKATIHCDLGNVSLSSTAKLKEKDGWSFDSLLRQRHELTGQVDIARLARLLPATLRLRQQVEVNSGQVKLELSSRLEQTGMKWHGRLEAADLTAVAAGRQIAWQRPVSLMVDAHETAKGPVVDALKCESDFLSLQASGSPDALVVSWSFNLKRLADQLGQFVDLGAVQWTGEGWGNVNWKRSPQQQFEADADLRLRNFQLAIPDQPPWREDDVVATISAKGKTDLTVQTRIDAATLNVKSGDDQLDARLVQPVENLRQGGVWPVRMRLQGQLQAWPGRLAVWLPTKNCRLTGAYSLEVDGTASKNSVELRQMKVAAAPLIVASPWLNLNEPRLDAAAAGSWDSSKGRLQIGPASLTCATVAIQADNVVLAMPETGPKELSGALKCQGDAGRLRQWFRDPTKPSSWQLAGQLSGTAELHQAAGVIRGNLAADLSNLAIVDSSGQQFQEPRLRLAVRGDYTEQTGVVRLEQATLNSDVLTANAAGRVAPVGGVSNADLSAQIGYDMERICGLLRPYIGSGVRIFGRGSSSAWYRGPFSLAAGSAAADLRWDWADVYGLQLGPGQLKAAMADGLLRVEPLDLAVSRGRMRLAPVVRLTPEPIEITLPKGRLAEQIQISPTLCASLLKYIAPVLADVTTAQGAFSVDLDGCRIPLGNPAKGELAGQFTIHSIEIGPGPLIRQFAVLLGREAPAKLRQESVVQFRMVGGRIYHQGLELVFPELTIRTHGSVGLDQTIAVMAEMPVPPKWLEKTPMISQALRNQTLQIPIGGTLSKPQLDQKVVQDLSRQFLKKAAGGMIEEGINKQLDRLFGPKK